MKVYALFLFIFLTSSVFGTTGEPDLIEQIRYYPEKEELLVFKKMGYDLCVDKVSLKTSKTTTLFCSNEETFPADQKRERELRKKGVKLRKIDLKKSGFSIKSSEFLNVSNFKDSNGRFKEFNVFPLFSEWKVNVDIAGKKSLDFDFSICGCYYPEVSFRGYSLPGRSFIFLVSSSKGICMEGGYLKEQVVFINNIKTGEDFFLENESGGEVKTILDSGTDCFYAYSRLAEIAFREAAAVYKKEIKDSYLYAALCSVDKNFFKVEAKKASGYLPRLFKDLSPFEPQKSWNNNLSTGKIIVSSFKSGKPLSPETLKLLVSRYLKKGYSKEDGGVHFFSMQSDGNQFFWFIKDRSVLEIHFKFLLNAEEEKKYKQLFLVWFKNLNLR